MASGVSLVTGCGTDPPTEDGLSVQLSQNGEPAIEADLNTPFCFAAASGSIGSVHGVGSDTVFRRISPLTEEESFVQLSQNGDPFIDASLSTLSCFAA